MQTATEFTALGAGNGFPSCQFKWRVDGYDYWTTLSGWSKVNEPASEADKKQSIADSLRLAMKWYWNIYKMNLTASISDGSETISMDEINAEDDGKAGYNSPQDAAILTPVSRICSKAIIMSKESELSEFGNYLHGVFKFGSIARMYDGPRDNEDNFVGYGLSESAIYVADDFFFVNVDIGGYGDNRYSDTDTDYCTIPITNSTDEFHAVCYAIGGDPSNRYSESSGAIGEGSETITVDSLELYTY
jgi:hypothetical protein